MNQAMVLNLYDDIMPTNEEHTEFGIVSLAVNHFRLFFSAPHNNLVT